MGAVTRGFVAEGLFMHRWSRTEVLRVAGWLEDGRSIEHIARSLGVTLEDASMAVGALQSLSSEQLKNFIWGKTPVQAEQSTVRVLNRANGVH